MDHFAAECLVSMSSRAVVHAPRGTLKEIKPESPSASRSGGEELRDPPVNKDNSSLFVVARILADFNQQSPNDVADQARIKEESAPSPIDGNPATPTGPSDPSLVRQRGKRFRGRVEPESPQKKHKCHYSGCDKLYGKSSHLKAHLRTHTGQWLYLLWLYCSWLHIGEIQKSAKYNFCLLTFFFQSCVWRICRITFNYSKTCLYLVVVVVGAVGGCGWGACWTNNVNIPLIPNRGIV